MSCAHDGVLAEFYSCSGVARNIDNFYQQLFGQFDAILNLFRPKRYVMFALDGPGPCAKLAEQQQRRKVGFREQMSKLKSTSRNSCTVLKQKTPPCFLV